MISLYAGLTSQTIDLFIQNSTTGAGETGLAYNTAGLGVCYRKGATATMTAITLATQTVGGAWSSGGFVEIDSTNAPGLYRLDLPNAAVDTAGFTTIYVKGTGVVSAPVRVDCRPLPSNVVQISGDSTAADNLEAAADGTGYNLGGGSIVAASVTGAVGSVTGGVTVTTNNDKTGYSLSQSFPTNFALLAITGSGAVTAGTVSDKTGYSLATAPLDAAGVRAAVGLASANLDTQLGTLATASALSALVTTVGVAGVGLTEAGGTGDQFAAIPWNAAWDTEVQSECTDALNAYDPPTKAEQDAAFTEIKGAGWSSGTDTLEKIKVDTAVARSAGVVTIGVISNAGTAVESYVYGGQTVTFAGLDASGNRSGVTVS